MNDYYKTLGVPKNSSQEEVKRAYRKLAHKYHPDKQGGDEKKFKEINEAYQVLGDERKKAQYDQFGSNFGSRNGEGFQGFDFNNFSGFSGRGGFGSQEFDLGDIFSEFFGGGARTRSRTKQRGHDIQIDAVISLEEAYSGVTRKISLKKSIKCPQCQGNKNEPGSKLNICKSCGGSGEVRQTHRTVLGSITQVHECNACSGEGKIPEKKCSRCRGLGIVEDIENISLDIPAGIHSGESMVINGKGAAGEGGYGNLYVQVHIRDHAKFERKGDDIYSDIQISIPQAVLGDLLKTQTLSGETDIKVPSGAESGAMIKLQGKGMSRLGGRGFGDHYARISIKTPQKLSKRARELFEELRKEGI
ncbi:MAG: molecular chaperone DnaJ [Candidatus Spechtbacterales bacterium]